MSKRPKVWTYVVREPKPEWLQPPHIHSHWCFDTRAEAEAYRDKYAPGCPVVLEEHEYGGSMRVESVRPN